MEVELQADDAYVPAPHTEQFEHKVSTLLVHAADLYAPALQLLHDAGGERPARQTNPAGQVMQTVVSAAVEYVPNGQARHTLSVMLVHRVLMYVPAAHSVALHGQ